MRRTWWRRLRAESGFWKDDLEAAHVLLGAARERRERAAVELDRAARRRIEAEQRARERRLAAARLADQPERLAGPDRGAHAVERMDRLPVLVELLGEGVDGDQGRGRAVDLDRPLELGGRGTRQLARVLVEVAAARMRRAGQLERRLLRRADRLREPATGREHATRQVLADRRQEPGDAVEATPVLARAAPGDAADQPDGVGVARVVEHGLDRALLDEPARVEHPHALAHLPDHAEVVADEQHGGVEVGLQRGDQVEHLGLDRRVEPGRRLVENQEHRILGERHRDHDALLHAAGELVRVAVEHDAGVGDLDARERVAGALERLAARHAADAEDLGHLEADLQRRVERIGGVLIDHRHQVRAHALQSIAGKPEHVRSGDANRPAADAPVAGQVANDGERRRRLATAGLADEPVRLARSDRERHAAQHRAVDPADAVDHIELLELERRSSRLAHRSSTCVSPSAARLTASTSDAIASAGNSTVHQYVPEASSV